MNFGTTGIPDYRDRDFCASPINAPPAAAAPPFGAGPIPDAIGYVRSDGVTAVIYRSSANHIIEVATQSPAITVTWVVSDLTTFTSGPDATTGSAFPYVRTDNTNSIVYIAADNHIHEIASTFPNPPYWQDWDLYANSGENIAPSTDPWAYRRSDGKSAVVFIATDNKLHELSLTPGSACGNTAWCAGIITAATSPTGGLFRRPSGYIRTDSKNAVVYISGSGTSLHEVRLTAGGWVDGEIPLNGFSPSGQPFGYTAPNNGTFHQGGSGLRNYVDLEGSKTGEGQVGIEVSLPASGTGAWDLVTNIWNCPQPGHC